MWAVAIVRASEKGGIYTGSKPTLEWRIDQSFGLHRLRIDAMRSYIEMMEPELKGTPLSHIRNHWKAQSRNLKQARLVKAAEQEVSDTFRCK